MSTTKEWFRSGYGAIDVAFDRPFVDEEIGRYMRPLVYLLPRMREDVRVSGNRVHVSIDPCEYKLYEFYADREKSYRSDKTNMGCVFLHVFQDEKGQELNERGLSGRRFLALTTALDAFVRVESCT